MAVPPLPNTAHRRNRKKKTGDYPEELEEVLSDGDYCIYDIDEDDDDDEDDEYYDEDDECDDDFDDFGDPDFDDDFRG